MDCKLVESLLHPFVDGEFGEAERLEVEHHLAGCADCTRAVSFERRFRQTLRLKVLESAVGAAAPPALRERVRVGLRAQARRRRVRTLLRVGAAAAVLAALGATTSALLPRKLEQFVVDAARRHSRVLPSEINARAHEEVEAWFHGKLDHRVPVPRFPDVELAGARISNVQDRPAAYIRYQKQNLQGGARTLGLFVFDDAKNELGVRPLPAAAVQNRLGYNVAVWREGEIVYELVSDLDEADIRRLLEAQHEERKARLAPAPLPLRNVAHER